MAINIKDEKLHADIKKLAAITGESQTGAVANAVREKLDRVRQRSPEEKLARLEELTKGMQDLWVEPWKSVDHGELLYDEYGLPK